MQYKYNFEWDPEKAKENWQKHGIRFEQAATFFQGEPVQTTTMVHMDTGLLIVTNKHLAFVGPQKSVRLKHDKIISHTPYSDGIGVCRDAVSAKPQVFITDDGWFTYNVIVNAARL